MKFLEYVQKQVELNNQLPSYNEGEVTIRPYIGKNQLEIQIAHRESQRTIYLTKEEARFVYESLKKEFE